ncbi:MULTISPECIES: hypothetical protein [unclassified Rhodanobacter]|uniref:DUF202 domain-containing protein n=1 Tax=Rhodanobacter humi TaxID=1888173 RepID=A0ABV4AVM0_9GAMM
MATLKEAGQRLDILSAQISAQVRINSLGVLAVTWLFLSGGKDSPALLGKIPKGELLAIAEFALSALLLDMIQYCIAYFRIMRRRNAAIKADLNEMKYPDDWLRDIFFYAKQILAGASAIWLISACIIALVK